MFWFVLVHLVTFLVDLVTVRRRTDRDKDLQILSWLPSSSQAFAYINGHGSSGAGNLVTVSDRPRENSPGFS